jgi:hypothetical protein
MQSFLRLDPSSGILIWVVDLNAEEEETAMSFSLGFLSCWYFPQRIKTAFLFVGYSLSLTSSCDASLLYGTKCEALPNES